MNFRRTPSVHEHEWTWFGCNRCEILQLLLGLVVGKSQICFYLAAVENSPIARGELIRLQQVRAGDPEDVANMKLLNGARGMRWVSIENHRDCEMAIVRGGDQETVSEEEGRRLNSKQSRVVRTIRDHIHMYSVTAGRKKNH